MDWDPMLCLSWMNALKRGQMMMMMIKITLNGKTNLQLSCTKQNSFSTACRLAARAVFQEMEGILSPATEKREWSPNC